MLARDSEDKFDQDLCLNFDMNPTLGSIVPLAMYFNFTWPVPDDDVKVQLIHLDDGEDDEDVAKDNSNAEEEEKQGPIVLLLQGVRCRGEVEVVRKKAGLVEQRKYSLIF